MGSCRLGLAVVIVLGVVIVLKPEPGSALTPTTIRTATVYPCCPHLVEEQRINVHFRRTQSSYCYPRNYWWFYRPYTTALDGHARCMPYFHYLQPYDGHGARPDRSIK